METAMERLSTGQRINSASDDAAGVAIASRMEANVKGLQQAIRNAGDAQGLISTAEGAQVEIVNILQRMREISVQSVNDTNSSTDRAALNDEVKQLRLELDRIATSTTWAGSALLDGTFVSKEFQIGADTGQTLLVSQDSMATADIGLHKFDSTGAVLGTAVATAALSLIATAADADQVVVGKNGSAIAATAINVAASAVAAAVNTDTNSTGVAASAHTAVLIDNMSAAPTGSTVSFTLGGGSGTSTITTTMTDQTDLTNLVTAINTYSGTTGVTAEFNGTDKSAIILREDDGDNIVVGEFTALASDGTTAVTIDMTAQTNFEGTTFTGSAATVGAAATTDSNVALGVVRMTSDKAFSLSGWTTGDYIGANTSGASSLSAISAVSVSSKAGAESAIAVIDGALGMVATSRAALGAYSNRLDSTISNLTNIANETEASRGRIMDADFAAETTNLSKAQILQQASTAMLAQANASKQNVLSLLQG
jgi:flagellin